MILRINTRPVHVGNVQIGGQDKVVIQSMCNIKTSHVAEVAKQINEATTLGAEIMRLAVLDLEDAKAISEIKKLISIPLVADIHFDYRLALAAMEAGVDAIRLNPGNIGSIDRIRQVVDMAKALSVPIRIGVNSGSIDRSIYSYDQELTAQHLVNSAKKHVKILEDLGFFDIVISLKGTDVKETIAAYRLASETFPYPLHLGITEAGTKEIGIIRSAAGLSPLLLSGIGDTIRISLSASPLDEIVTAKRLLHDLGLYPNYPTLISCPTCGRTQVDVIALANKVLTYIEKVNKPITVAVMGCVVNGPGEASNADIGLAGGRGQYAIFKKGKVIASCPEDEAFARLKKEIDNL
ncbi:MAG: flavodoxin-dependent (E)-4-hydroxy-3-methylbut-2-enyl-diphosphate synthase [Bacilli bacterium]|jgi:(E)-4-hydroxy-3-methylbut-2-enyl-diphosphate synthase|nr:flavodoxin-dependent (E)-4-hydroxy-3-methylbut-2-enyl-diphosphate synthase [Bacilli bacterium]MCH4202289.1 flavodoxin-dependent (E)-4-hydroxy-3-methylbut-2-enyl-diphosphate synthase [Bacilli bacterium]MCH4236045.1 flavodoxin-dependent (E)-4-hydroxy-3-methylbut-2-enyl-diphosphate synthase [Bacilli bacterium]